VETFDIWTPSGLTGQVALSVERAELNETFERPGVD
jgi:hypothetical protein